MADEPGLEALADEPDRTAKVYRGQRFEQLGPQGSCDHRAGPEPVATPPFQRRST